MGIGYDIGRAIGSIGKQRQKREAPKMSQKEVNYYLSVKQKQSKMASLERRYNAYIEDETRKAHEGMTVWNYIFKTGKFKDW